MPTIIPITDFAAPELDIYARLTENQLLNRADPANALFVAESPLVIGRALDAGCTPVSFLMETKHVNGKGAEILARCPADIPVYAAELEVLTQLTGFHLTRGMLCAMRRPKLQSVEDVCRDARRVVVLENVMNPTNIGAIFRSAAALGVDAVLLTSAGSDPLYRRAVRVSMGTVFQLPWTYLPADTDWQETLHTLGFRTAAEVLLADAFCALGIPVTVVTEDGTMGARGFVTDALPESGTYVYACGPMPMLQALCSATPLDGQLSLEARMGCGFGACMGCTCETTHGSKRVCKDGPVFTKEEIVWPQQP